MMAAVAVVHMSEEASRNTFNPENFGPIRNKLMSLMGDPTCKAVVLTGSGKFFSAGGPVDEFADAINEGTIVDMVSEMTKSLHSLILEIRASDTVFVSAINGAAAGGGLGLALSTDYRICSDKAKIAAAVFCTRSISGWRDHMAIAKTSRKPKGQEVLLRK